MTEVKKEYSARHGIYMVHPNGDEDVVFMKEYQYNPDGTVETRMRPFRNFERSFWVTKKGHRNHQDRKDSEELSKLREFKTTQFNLANAVAKAVNYNGRNRSLKAIVSSNMGQYIYGTDISTVSLIKGAYDNKWPERVKNPATYAALDIETDVVNHHADDKVVSMVSVAYNGVMVLHVVRRHLEKFEDKLGALRDTAMRLAPDYFGEGGTWKLDLRIVETGGEACKGAIDYLHEVGPDYVGIWNINFDLPAIMAQLTKDGYNIHDVFCDPTIPGPYRYVEYKVGLLVNVTDSGREKKLEPQEQWHYLRAPAKFQWLCAMSVNQFLNVHLGKRPYNLDATLERELGTSKLKPVEIGEPSNSLKWHAIMQKEYPLEYCVYNMFDTIRMIELDAKTGDVARSVPSQLGVSEISKFRSTPGKIVDDMDGYAKRKEGKIMGTMPMKMEGELDQYVVGADNWIVTLASYMLESSQYPIFTDAPRHLTRIYRFNFDSDIEGTYPNLENGLNVGKNSNRFEVSRIQGVSDQVRRYVGVDLALPEANAFWLSGVLNKAPSVNDVLTEWSDWCDKSKTA